jgi:uncharacterized protein (TIGR04255 family)
MQRPDHLPDYKAPPLNEVVLGAQFTQPTGYQQIRAGEVWSLFKANFPLVEEQPPLTPSFETFGGRPTKVLQFGIAAGAMHDRFWFLSDKKDELIQFQADRLLHNWRKVGDGSNPYPRFEKMIESFEAELQAFESYISSLASQKLTINQCEVSYINHIVLGDRTDPGWWLRFLDIPESQKPDDISVNLRRVLRNSDGSPLGRQYIEAASGFTPKGDQIIAMTLTVRGAPQGTTVCDAVKFICNGRDAIVTTFAEVTTDAAQEVWERVK